MNIKQLEYFIDLSKSLNFTKTAHHFYISQTAITKQIQNLEEELGFKLFIRDKKNVTLSDEGRLFLHYAVHIINDVQEAVSFSKAYVRGQSGIIRIGFIKNSDEALIIQILQTIKKQFPLVKLEYRAYRRIELVSLFNKKEIDLMIMIESASIQSSFLLLKEYVLKKYYHKEGDLTTLPLLYDASNDQIEDTELEQTLLKISMKEGYAILKEFIDKNHYYKYLTSSPTSQTSSLCLYYQTDPSLLIQNVLKTIKDMLD